MSEQPPKVDIDSDETYVREFSFRKFTGFRQGRLHRVYSVADFNFRHQLANNTWLKVLIGFVFFSLVMQNLFIFATKQFLLMSTTPTELAINQTWFFLRGMVQFNNTISANGGQTFSIGGMSIFVLIASILMGAGLIANDIRYKATEVYYSKLGRGEYILGKLGAFMLFGHLLFVFPAIAEWFLLVIGIGDVQLLDALPALIGVIIFGETLSLVFGSIILAFSSITNRKLYSGLMVFLLIFLLSILIPSLTFDAKEFTPLIYLDVFTVLLVFSYMLTGASEVAYNISGVSIGSNPLILDLTGLAGWLVIPTILLFVGLSLLVVVIQVYWRHARS